jgi:voltage-gated potassium channel
VVAALATDTDNVFLVLTARQLAPELLIMARASQETAKIKLRAAGANYVESPYEMGAVSMAHRIIRPTVTSFLDLAFAHKRKDIQMEEIPVSNTSELVNVQLKDSGIRQKYNLIIIAIMKPDGNMLFNPSFEAVIEPNDTVIAVGEADNLQKLEWVLNPSQIL